MSRFTACLLNPAATIQPATFGRDSREGERKPLAQGEAQARSP